MRCSLTPSAKYPVPPELRAPEITLVSNVGIFAITIAFHELPSSQIRHSNNSIRILKLSKEPSYPGTGNNERLGPTVGLQYRPSTLPRHTVDRNLCCDALFLVPGDLA